MTTLLSAPPPAPGSSGVVLRGVSWDFYERMLREIGDQHVRLTYDEGRLEIMAPSDPHEWQKKLIARLIETYTLEMEIPLRSAGSTTFKRKALRKGLEPDECYYVATEPAVRGRKRVDREDGPAPDLAIEVEVTHRELDREAIYAALGVSELWRYDGRTVEFLRLTGAGRYRRVARSVAFPALTRELIQGVLTAAAEAGETAALRQFQAWARERAPGPR